MTNIVGRRYLALLPLMVMSNAFAGGFPDSAASVNDFCQRAQQVIASTDLQAFNLIHSADASFIESSPAPYDNGDNGEEGNLAAYNGKGDPALLPLTTQQFVTYAEGYFGREYPQVISCKMKSSEAIQAFIDPSAAGSEVNCSDIIGHTVEKIMASLPSRWLTFDESEIVIEPDIVARSGPEWLAPFPPSVAFIGDDGLLHLQGKALKVPVNLPPIIPIGDDKKGVHYCHLPAPGYIVRLATGVAQP